MIAAGKPAGAPERIGSRAMRRSTTIAFAAVALAALPACTLSNRMFEEDAFFAGAVPEAADLRAEHPGSRNADGALVDDERDEGDPALVPPRAREVARGINGAVFYLLAMLDFAMDLPITAREQDTRTWGPYERAQGGGSVRLDVRRQPEDVGRFEYSVVLAADSPQDVTSDSPWDEVVAGWFLRGGGSLREGVGGFCWDADVWAAHSPGYEGGGLVCVDHERDGDLVRLHATFDDWLQPGGDSVAIEYFFEAVQGGGGVLEYLGSDDVVGGTGGTELSATRVRWAAGGAGRADLLVSGGDVPVPGVPASECWDADLARTWWFVDMPGAEPDVEEGSQDDCAFAGREEVREIGV